jgi:hypothetical protein
VLFWVERTLLSFDLKKIRIIELTIVFLLGLIPLFWFRSGYFFANGDDFPLFLNAHQTFTTGISMWSTNYLGYATPLPAYLLFQYLGALLSSIGFSVSTIQTLIQIFLFILAGFSIFYLTTKIYTKSTIAPFLASLFYMFNIFFLINMRNIGFMWTYAFLPLILALFYEIMTAASFGDKKRTHTNIIYFALMSVVAFSFASINPANVALFLIGLTVFAFYFLFKLRHRLKSYFLTVAKIISVTFPINLWWIIPVMNSFIFSGQALNSDVGIDSWSWTHARASFLNLFWLNGSWNWSREYYPFVDFYSNSILTILVFVPFIVAASALLFKSDKPRFNAFLMGCILLFIFIATGLHYRETFGQLNRFLYNNISLMSLFREPVSKFTIVMLPFLALLIGFGSERIAHIKVRKISLSLSKGLISLLLVIILLVSVFPILKGSMNNESEALPFSSHVKVPDYWYQAADWINSQPGDWRVLLTPINDFYQMPNSWGNYTSEGWSDGYYGTDQLLERLLEKPIVSTANLNGYVGYSNSSLLLRQIRESVKFHQTDEFKALLDLLSIKYIVQRNDVNGTILQQVEQRNDVNMIMHERDLMQPFEMQAFFAQQSYLKLVGHYGQLDLYQYTEAKPSIYALTSSTLDKIDIHIDTSTVLDHNWAFSISNQNDLNDFEKYTPNNQSQATCLITQGNRNLTANMWNSSSSWITVDSPLIPTDKESIYQIDANISAINDNNITLAIAEFSQNKALLSTSSLGEIIYGNGTFSWWSTISNKFEPKNEKTAYIQIQIWNYFNATETNQTLSPTTLFLDKVTISHTASTLNKTGIAALYTETASTSAIMNIKNVSPTRIVITVNTSNPFILVTNQELDRFWVATVNGQTIQPVNLYLGLKGFVVNKTGELSVTLEYEPQSWFNWGLMIFGITVLLLCVGLIFNHSQRFWKKFQHYFFPFRKFRFYFIVLSKLI